ncbi:hypothetical protein Ddc_02343 [Ditylenchus destructor]|nr:hypothetical protein Ddc_02343 [Ditylenchus destructor]
MSRATVEVQGYLQGTSQPIKSHFAKQKSKKREKEVINAGWYPLLGEKITTDAKGHYYAQGEDLFNQTIMSRIMWKLGEEIGCIYQVEEPREPDVKWNWIEDDIYEGNC